MKQQIENPISRMIVEDELGAAGYGGVVVKAGKLTFDKRSEKR